MDHKELQVNPYDVINKLRLLYPTNLAHAIAEVKCDVLAAQLGTDETEETEEIE